MPTIKGVEFKLGADPEGFLWDTVENRFVSAYGKMPGTKQQPVPIPYGLGTMQVDGVAVEFNTPVRTLAYEFSNTINSCIFGVNNYFRNRYRVRFQPTVKFDDEEWASIPDEAKILGCDPDFCGWTMNINPAPDAAGKKFRTGAGHIHIGWNNGMELNDDLFQVAGTLAKELDATVGVASLLYDRDKDRRKLYGKAGAFRPKHYGMEYRTLSNAWVGKPGLRRYVAGRVIDALRNMMNKRPIHSKEIRQIINKNKVGEARYWLEHHKITLPPAGLRVD